MPLAFVPPTADQWRTAYQQPYDKMVKAAQEALTATAQMILTQGRAEIAGAGFSARWQKGLVVDINRGRGIDGSLHAHHKIGYATVFETGTTIVGKPLLWLPLPTVPDSIGSKPMTPKQFVANIGPLFTMRTGHGGPPLLGGYMQGLAGSNITIAKLRRGSALHRLGVRGRGGQSRASKGLVLTPLFFGVTSVTLRKRWNVEQVYADAQQQISRDFLKRLGVT